MTYRLRVLFALILLALGLGPAAAAYPERYIAIICASGAGGIVDVTTRILAEHMSRTLGRNVVVQNEPGAGSTLAIAAVAKAAPDGYTVLTIGPGISVVTQLYPNASVDVRRDLQPVSVMGAVPLVLLTHKDVPVTDYASLVAYLKGKVRILLDAIAAGQMQATGTLQDFGAPAGESRGMALIDIVDDTSGYQIPVGSDADVAVYTDHFEGISLLRRILLRMRNWENYVFLEAL